jgi:hypothetical protein
VYHEEFAMNSMNLMAALGGVSKAPKRFVSSDGFMMLRTIEAGPAISRHDVEVFERSYGVDLPDAYREFLALRNGGRPERDLVAVPGCSANPVARIHFFFGIGYPLECYDILWNIDVYGDRIPKGHIPIATTEGSDMICLSPSEEVVYWDGYKYAVFPVARTFEEFVALLHGDERSPRIAGRPDDSVA